MFDHPERIPLESCVDRNVYKLTSRNLSFGVFRESTKGFIGIREKFGDRYLFEEYHWDTGPPFGTANPLKDLGPVPDSILVVESLGSKDSVTGRAVAFDDTKIPGEYLYPPSEKTPDPPLAMKGWYFLDTGEFSKEIRPYREPNKELFEYLDGFEPEEPDGKSGRRRTFG